MPEAYLTIDDSPTPRTGELLDFLKKRDIQALFFCRGDFMEQHPQAPVQILEAGHILGNHLYSHQPASQLGYEAVIAEIERTEHLITQAYEAAGIARHGYFIRFPYLDRGDGDKTEQRFNDLVQAVQSGSNDPFLTSELTDRLQAFLHAGGYRQPFPNVSHPLYKAQKIRDAADCLLTYTSFDWMLSPRHRGRHDYKTVQDLKEKIDTDTYLLLEGGVNIVLFHDDREGIVPEVCDLIDHMNRRGLTFKEYQT